MAARTVSAVAAASASPPSPSSSPPHAGELQSSFKYGAPEPRHSRQTALAAGVLAVWGLALLPPWLGWQRCAFARIVGRPCPGCGMTRAVRLLWEGQMQASLRMHPLAIPVLAALALLVLSTTEATLARGSPVDFYRTFHGRAALAFAAAVYAAMLGLWVMRWFGAFGGPAPL